MQTITAEKLEEVLGDANTEVINVLSEDAYNQIHIQDSINIPLDQLQDEAWKHLDEDKNYVVYCANAACQASPKAAEFLQSKGFNVKDFEGGMQEWAEKDLPVEGEQTRDEYLDED